MEGRAGTSHRHLPWAQTPTLGTDTYPGHSEGQSSPGDTGTVLSQGHSGRHSGSHRLVDTPDHKIHLGRLEKTEKSTQNAELEPS